MTTRSAKLLKPLMEIHFSFMKPSPRTACGLLMALFPLTTSVAAADPQWNLAATSFLKSFVLDAGSLVLLEVVVSFALLVGWRAWGRAMRVLVVLQLLGTLVFTAACFAPTTNLLSQALRADQPLGACLSEHRPIVILGGGLVAADLPSSTTILRVRRGGELAGAQLSLGYHPIVVFSGGPTLLGTTATEAKAMEEEFLRSFPDVAPITLVREDESLSTYENAQFTATIWRDRQLALRIHLVTSAEHMRRAKGVFSHMGFDVCPASPADVRGSWYPQIFSFRHAVSLVGALNEVAGLAGYRAKGWL